MQIIAVNLSNPVRLYWIPRVLPYQTSQGHESKMFERI